MSDECIYYDTGAEMLVCYFDLQDQYRVGQEIDVFNGAGKVVGVFRITETDDTRVWGKFIVPGVISSVFAERDEL